ncbi:MULTISPECIES: hypothetical protein [Acinetobacter calcoaceticus/baumannii complex]|uniref:hypothetical protein n=1 Tax=Acinetobacter calcoaceticus/baumannii complex TaxID=909768 RepID=UPI00044F2F1D|nr:MULTISPECIES: hypothetical protein [Acinetobacter calcoaceticus/baumannii complex]KCY66251.1 hypothetical protein J608_2065 [Acinetobacter baumannii 1288284]EXE92063.1 hypothetical protein J588_1302 [Acinetobacter sp. 1578804]EXS03035.1 hypothetical protein J687_0267 [Acinetobacter sp. 225588]KAI0681333.1 hypothetical protein A6010_00255 [Acinetobacter pittii]MBA0120308.1 hypothetical protein [Acinetobacter pittii]
MRMRRLMLAAATGLMAFNFSALTAMAAAMGEASPFVNKLNSVKNKPNKLSQKKKRLIARRLNKHK